MRLRDDTRAAAIQIGAVLLFAVLIIALASYQAVIVPDQNRADEFDHNKQVHGDLQDVRNAVLSAVSNGAPQSASVGLGTEFQNRIFFLNPPDPAGTLAVESGEPITIENAVGTETNGYWNTSIREYETATISYEPGYREYYTAPTTRYEHSLVYNAYEDSTVSTGDQRLLAGETISMIGLTGEGRTSHSGTASVDVTPLSAGSETVQVTGEDDPIRLTIPTRAPDIWAEQFEEQTHVSEIETGEDRVVVSLETVDENDEPIVYDLRAGASGIDGSETRPQAAYLVFEGSENTTVGQPISAEIRDRYDNPVAGENVSVDRDGERIDETRSNRDGRTQYYPEEEGEYELRIGEEAYERVAFHVEDEEDEHDGSEAAFQTVWDMDAIAAQEGVACETNCTINDEEISEPELTVETNRSAEGAAITYATNDTEIVELGSNNGTTDSNGTDTVPIEPLENGTVTVFAWGGGSGDSLELTIDNVSQNEQEDDSEDENQFDRLTIHDESTTIPAGQDGRASYEIEYELTREDTTIEIDFENLDQPDASESLGSEDRAGTLGHEPSFSESNRGDRYTITITVAAEDGTVLHEEIVRDTADGTDPEI
jgi:hypothetical protein